MRKIPKSRSWAASLEEFKTKAEALPPGSEKTEMEEKVRRMEQAIRLRESFSFQFSIHREQRKNGNQQTEGQRSQGRREKAIAIEKPVHQDYDQAQ